MASSNADCVLGEARLISSARSTLAKTPPGRNWNSSAARLHTETPVTSEGGRSGVNWMRWQGPPIDAAIALASDVLPTPGTSSMRRCPSASMHTSARCTCSRLPWITRSTLPSRAENSRPNDESRLGTVVGWTTNTSRAKPRRYQRVSRAQWQCSGERSATGTVRTHDARAVGDVARLRVLVAGHAARAGAAAAVVDGAAPGGAAGPAALVGECAVRTRARSGLPALPVRDPVRRRRPPRSPRPGRLSRLVQGDVAERCPEGGTAQRNRPVEEEM